MIYVDDHLPTHVHAIGTDCMIRIGLEPLEVLSSIGANEKEVRKAVEIAERRSGELLAAWRKHHG
jgi:hypothetical protein